MCSTVVYEVMSFLEVIPVFWKQVGSISATHMQNYFSLYELLRELQAPVDDTMGKILLLPSCSSVSRLHLFP